MKLHPGHMALLRAADGLLDVAMAEMACVTPAVMICEMLDDESGYTFSKADAKICSWKHGLVFVEGCRRE